MRKVLPIAIAAMLLCSCRVTQLLPVKYEVRDSTVIHERTVVDTAYIDIPRDVVRTVTIELSSHLENDYAVTDAVVDTLGLLHHSLETKPQRVKAPVEVHVTDTLWMKGETSVVQVEVERKLTGWQRMTMTLGKIMLVLIAVIILAGIGVCCYRIFVRRQ